MAGEWLKFEKATPDKPEVFAIASALNMDPDAVVGKLLRVWIWFDTHTTDGNGRGVTLALLDRISGVSGFAAAMQSVSWLDSDEFGVSLPKFDRHTGETAKGRALTAKRVAKHKDSGNAKGNGDSVSSVVTPALPREEKRREERTRAEARKPEVSPEAIVQAYHEALPRCMAVSVLTPKRKRTILAAASIAKAICRDRGWEYGPDFWRDFFAECAKDPYYRGDVPNPKNAAWKQHLGVLLSDEHFAKIMDNALAGVSA